MKTIKYIFTFLLLLAIVSCSSKKDITEKYLKYNPSYLAEKCAINFPSVTKYVEGETKTTETVVKILPGIEIPCPEIMDENGNKQIPKVNCPDQKIVETIKIRTDTIYVENTANVIRLKQENITLADELKKEKELVGELKKTVFIRTILFLVLVMTSLYSIYSRFK